MPPLRALGLSSDTLSLLAAHGISSVEDFLVRDLYKLPGLTSGSESGKLKKSIAEVFSHLENAYMGWNNGRDLFNGLEKSVRFLSTGCESLDSMLQGGLRQGTITELVGPSSCGKSQLCMQTAAATAQRHIYTTVYVDTSNSFSSGRIVQMIATKVPNVTEKELKTALGNILYYTVYDVYALLDLLHNLHLQMSSPCQEISKLSRLGLFIVDSPSSLISTVLGASHVRGHALMMAVGNILKKICTANNIAILMTNHTVAGEGGSFKPALGESWKCVPHVRVLVEKDMAHSVCSISLVKHTSMACNRRAHYQF